MRDFQVLRAHSFGEARREAASSPGTWGSLCLVTWGLFRSSAGVENAAQTPGGRSSAR